MAGAQTLKHLFDEKKIAVLQVFIQRPQEEFALKEIVKKSKVPLATTHRIMKFLLESGFVSMTKIKHLTLYKLTDSEDTRFLSQLFYEKPAPLAKFVDLVASVPGIEKILMHGKETESRANIVIIGSGINKDPVNASVGQIREEDHFTISHLILENEQFEILERMGQFSGSKTVLYTK